MLDFAALPPEINSARMYCGPGSAPMLAAASAWDALAAQLELYTAGYSSTLADLNGQTWSGGASIAMNIAAAPYVAWAAATAAQAEQAAAQARAAAAAYEMAFAATVPPPVVVANRIQLATLVATNFFGQNTPAIAANEAHYAEMWAQDAAAMYGYAASSSAATTLEPFNQPPQTTNTGGQSAQTAAVAQATSSPTGQIQATVSQMMSAVSQQLQTLATGGSSGNSTSSESSLVTSVLTLFKDAGTLLNPAHVVTNLMRTSTSAGGFASSWQRSGFTTAALAAQEAAKAAKAAAAAANALGSAGARGPVLASVGNATPLGRLSVPQSWLVADPAHLPPLSGAEPRAVLASETHPATNALGGLPTARGAGRSTDVPVLRNGRRIFAMPRPPCGG